MVQANLFTKQIVTDAENKLIVIKGESRGGINPPDGSVGKKICLQCRRHRKFGFSPWEVKDPLEDKNGNAL